MDAQVKNYVNTHLSGDSQRGFHATNAAKAVGLKKGSQLAKFLKDNKIEMEAFKALYTHTPQTHLNDLQGIVQDFVQNRNVQVLKGVTDAVKSEEKIGEARVEASKGKAAYQGDIQFKDFRKDILKIQDLANGGNKAAEDLLDYLNNNFLPIYDNENSHLNLLHYAEAAMLICITTHTEDTQAFNEARLDGLTNMLWNQAFEVGQPGERWYAMTVREKKDFLNTVTEFKGIFTDQLNNPPATADAGKIAVARREINEKLNTIDARALAADGQKYPLKLHMELQTIVENALKP